MPDTPLVPVLPERVRCMACSRVLKDDVSRARKVGPHCWHEIPA